MYRAHMAYGVYCADRVEAQNCVHNRFKAAMVLWNRATIRWRDSVDFTSCFYAAGTKGEPSPISLIRHCIWVRIFVQVRIHYAMKGGAWGKMIWSPIIHSTRHPNITLHPQTGQIWRKNLIHNTDYYLAHSSSHQNIFSTFFSIASSYSFIVFTKHICM